MKRIYFLSLVMMVILLVDCKKDATLTKKEMLTGKYWILSACTVNPALSLGGPASTNIFSQMDECLRDNITIYNSNGTFTMEEGATKCNSDDPLIFESGTWAFNADETVISRTQNNSVETANIISLSASKLQITFEATYNDIKYTYIATYVVK